VRFWLSLPLSSQSTLELRRLDILCTVSRVLFFCVASMLSASATAVDEDASEMWAEPEQSAAGFIARSFSVKPEQVTVTIINRDKNSATAISKVPGWPTCVLDLVLASEVSADEVWLVGDVACDKTVQEDHG